MSLPARLFLYTLSLTICLASFSAASKLHQSVKPSPPHLQKLRPGLSYKPSCARLFTSAAPQGLSDSSKTSFRDNMTSVIESQLSLALLQEVREFWFEHLDDTDSFIIAGQGAFKRWYRGGDVLDQACVKRFAPILESLRAAGVKTGDDVLQVVQPKNPLDWLSLVILLDQIPRNCYRGASSSVVFNFFDPLARDITLTAIEQGIPDTAPEIRWQFMYRSWFTLPLMHSENPVDHDKATEEYRLMAKDIHDIANTVIASEVPSYRAKAAKVVQKDVDAAISIAQVSIDFEKKHYDIIKRFGRYPHRNEALGREYTTEERKYLDEGGETFGSTAS